MVQISEVMFREVINGERFDAEFFKPEYIKIYKNLNKLELNYLEDFAFITDGQHGYFETDKNSKIRQIVGRDMIDEYNFLDRTNASKLALFTHNKNLRSNLEIDDIILSTVGTVGKVGIVIKETLPANINQSVCRIHVKDKLKLDPYFLSVFLKSKYGQLQIEKYSAGQVQIGFYLHKVRRLLIPEIDKEKQKSIGDFARVSMNTYLQSKQLYKQAEELLLEELNLKDFKPEQKLTFEANINEVIEAQRYDSDYFQPKYKEIVERIESYNNGHDVVDNIIQYKKGFEVGSESYLDEGLPFVRVSDFSIFGITDNTKKIAVDLYNKLKKQYQPKKSEILYTKDGTLGLAYLLNEDFEGILSGAFMRLTLKNEYHDFKKECLTLIFNSILCKMQVEKLSGGALIAHLKPSDFINFKIPLIKKEVQEKIAELVQESFKLREESKQLLEDAKRKIEEEIEMEANK